MEIGTNVLSDRYFCNGFIMKVKQFLIEQENKSENLIMISPFLVGLLYLIFQRFCVHVFINLSSVLLKFNFILTLRGKCTVPFF